MTMTDEPQITINGHQCSVGEAMTIRVAVESFAMSLGDPDALGKDEHGRNMTAGYLAQIDDIRKKIFNPLILPTDERCRQVLDQLADEPNVSSFDQDFIESNEFRQEFTAEQREVIARLIEKFEV